MPPTLFPWHNENPQTHETVQTSITQAFPALCPVSVKFLGEGWDNTTWLINQKYVFRFPKHALALKLLQNEIPLLSLLHKNKPTLPVKIPQPEFIYMPDKYSLRGFYGHLLLTGQTADRGHLDDLSRIHLARPLGEFLKALHAVPVEIALKKGIGYDQIDRINIASRLSKFEKSLDYLVKCQILKNNESESWLSFLKQSENFAPDSLKVLGHGDLYAKHMVLNQSQQLSAIIDWGDAEILHPGIDLAIVYQFLPIQAHDNFWQAYSEKVSENTKMLAKFRSIYSAITALWYAHHVKDNYLMQENLNGLKLMRHIL